MGDPEGWGIKLLERMQRIRREAEVAGIDISKIRPDPIVEKAAGLARRWEEGDSAASVELLNLIIETRKAAEGERDFEQKPPVSATRTGAWSSIKRFLTRDHSAEEKS